MRRAFFAVPLFLMLVPGCRVKELEAELDKTKAQLASTEAALSGEQGKNAELTKENQTYQERITELEGELASINTQLEELAAKHGMTAKELAELRADKAKREKELQVYRDLFDKLRELVEAGTIDVVFRKGRMTVKLSNAILFDSGKARLRSEGLDAVAQLVPALLSVGDREFLVAGHTDNVPIKTARYKSNWELSTARAVTMVTAMVDAGYPPNRIGAAGFAEHDPISSNDDDVGREQNRRIEIILMPNLGEIPGMKKMLQSARKKAKGKS